MPKTVQGVFGSSLETIQLKKEVAILKDQMKKLLDKLQDLHLIMIYKNGDIVEGSLDLDRIEEITNYDEEIKQLQSDVKALEDQDGYDDSKLIERIEKLEEKK